jgi:hypothetical protein
MESRIAEVTLQGKTLCLRTTADERTLSDLVGFANERLDEAGRAGLPPLMAALLTVLNLSEALHEERRRLVALREKVRRRSTGILEALDGGGRLEPGDGPPEGGTSNIDLDPTG